MLMSLFLFKGCLLPTSVFYSLFWVFWSVGVLVSTHFASLSLIDSGNSSLCIMLNSLLSPTTFFCVFGFCTNTCTEWPIGSGTNASCSPQESSCTLYCFVSRSQALCAFYFIILHLLPLSFSQTPRVIFPLVLLGFWVKSFIYASVNFLILLASDLIGLTRINLGILPVILFG